MITNEEFARVSKITLRSELHDLEAAATLYEQNARHHDEEGERLRGLARQAREQAENLKAVAGL